MMATTGFKKLLATFASSNTTAPSAVAVAEPVNFIPILGSSSVRLRFLGDTDGDSYTVAIYAVDVDGPEDKGTRLGYHSTLFGTATITIGTQAGVAGMLATVGDLYADTVTWAEDAFGTDLLAFVGAGVTIRQHSPVDDTIGELLIGDISNLHGISIVFGALSNETANLLYKLDSPPRQ